MPYEKYIICSLFIVEYMFCELQSPLLKKAEDTDGDASEVSATKIRQQQMQQEQNSTALVVADPQPANGGLHPVSVPKTAAPARHSVCTLYSVTCIILKLLFLCLLFSTARSVEL